MFLRPLPCFQIPAEAPKIRGRFPVWVLPPKKLHKPRNTRDDRRDESDEESRRAGEPFARVLSFIHSYHPWGVL